MRPPARLTTAAPSATPTFSPVKGRSPEPVPGSEPLPWSSAPTTPPDAPVVLLVLPAAVVVVGATVVVVVVEVVVVAPVGSLVIVIVTVALPAMGPTSGAVVRRGTPVDRVGDDPAGRNGGGEFLDVTQRRRSGGDDRRTRSTGPGQRDVRAGAVVAFDMRA